MKLKKLLTTAVLSAALLTGAHATPASKAKIKLPSGFEQSYIGIFVNDNVNSAFYGVIMNKKEQPFLPIADTLHHWLQMSITNNSNSITATLQSTQQQYRFSKTQETLFAPRGKTINIPRDALIYAEGKYWLRYDVWQQWLPLMASWNLQAYELYFEPNFTLSSDLAARRTRQLIEDKAEQKREERLKHIKAIKPNDDFNIQARGRLDWTRPTQKQQSLSTSYQGNIDLFGGTLATSGQTILDRDGTYTPPGYWSYTFLNKGGFHRILFGDFSNQQTLLVPSLSLQNGIDITRLKNTNPANGFSYQGHTLPGTEINVFHNGLLVTIIRADKGGNFFYSDPNGVPGDRYTFRFFFADGTQANRVIQLSPDDILVPKGKWNAIVQNGYLDNDQFDIDTGLAVGRMTHAELWYGLSKNFSIGAEGYNLPTKNHKNMGGIDAVWQTLPTWTNVIETLNYGQHTDVGYQSSFTGITHNTLQFTLKQQDKVSPINQLAYPQPFAPQTLLPEILPSATHSMSLNDIVNYDAWQGNVEYRHTNVGDNADIGINRAITSRLTLSSTLGVVHPKNQDTQHYKSLNAMYLFNDNSTLSASQNFVKNDNSTIVTYSRYSSSVTGWDYGVGYSKQEGEQWSAFASVQWRVTPFAAIAVTGQRHSVFLTLSLYGMIAEKPGPTDYNNFASGTLYGEVRAPLPSSNGSVPIKNARIDIGGQIATTDQNGHYFLTGLPTNTRLSYRVEADSLSANLIPDQDVQVVYLRPGTDIHLNPKIDLTAGLDGQLQAQSDIPRGTKVVIKNKNGNVIETADVEPNGFFVLNKLREQKYTLEFTGLKNPPKAKTINLAVKGQWLSDVDVAWQAPKHHHA